MQRLIFSAFLSVLMLAGIASGQASCPTVQTTGPSVETKAGEDLMFSVNVSGGDMKVLPTYNWTVSAGTISSGQGKSVIKVDTSGAGGQWITATVEVGGFDRACSTASSWTSEVSASVSVAARKYDEFNYLGPAKLEFERLDEFAIGMSRETDSTVHVIFYLGRKGLPGAIKAWSQQTVSHLVKRGIEKTRISVEDGGYRENGSMEIFIVPNGAKPPEATPTVDPSEITPRKKTQSRKSK